MQIRFAHFRALGADLAVFDADSTSGRADDRHELLEQLAASLRGQGLNVDHAALTYSDAGRVKVYGVSEVVTYLTKAGMPRWTHRLEIP